TQRVTQRHQKSPGCRPGKSSSGKGVIRSLPTFCEKLRNSDVICAHTVCCPRSVVAVWQKPLRKYPVIGSKQQLDKGSPNTFKRLRFGSGCIDIGTESKRSFFLS